MQTVLVTGGAGYIGSAAVHTLVQQGYSVVVIDNLSKGQRDKVNPKAIFYQADIVDKDAVETVFSKHHIDAVMHFAAYKAVGESMQNAPKYSDNIVGTIHVLNAMVKNKVPTFIFSSSAVVYAAGENILTEESHTEPLNYYGFTKLECERIANWYGNIHNIKIVNLRYFNVIGDAGLRYIEKDSPNIMPVLMEHLAGKRDIVEMFGSDYNTPDGTCVRDYIDIQDIVEAHVLALQGPTGTYNLGTQKGTSVLELIRAAEKITGKNILRRTTDKRAGDPPRLVASSELAKRKLRWKPKRTIEDSLKSVYQAYI